MGLVIKATKKIPLGDNNEFYQIYTHGGWNRELPGAQLLEALAREALWLLLLLDWTDGVDVVKVGEEGEVVLVILK